MEKDIIDSLNNVARSLENLVTQLGNKAKDNVQVSAKVNKGVDHITEIKAGIEEIRDDNKKILKNQETIIKSVQRQEQRKSIFASLGGRGEDKGFVDSLKTGTANIMLIASGILAIGAAFLLIGQVDFASVIALGITLPLLMHAFEKIGDSEHFKNPGTIATLGSSVLIMSGVLVASSHILQFVRPVDPMQLITAVGIAGIIYILSQSIGRATENIKDISATEVILLPLIMATASAAIVGSSYLLEYVKPIDSPQLLTTVAIAGVMYLITSGVNKASQHIKGITTTGVLMLPFIMVTASIAIAASSHILRGVVPIGMAQIVTSLAISGTFVVMAYAISNIARGLRRVNSGKLLELSVMIPILMYGMSLAINKSSHLLADIKLIPISNLMGMVLTTTALSTSAIIYSASIWAISKFNLTFSQIIMGTLTIALVAESIRVTSNILSNMTPISAEILINSLVLTATLSVSAIIFSGASWVIGKMGVGPKELGIGALAMLTIAGVVALSSHLIAMGNYGNVPPLEWAVNAGASMLVFGIATLGLGLVIGLTGGAGAVAMLAGAVAVVALAGVISGTSHILATGDYSKIPSVDWAKGTGATILAFGLATGALGVAIAGTLGFGALALAAGAGAVVNIAKTISETSHILATGNYGGGPTEQWSKGVALAIGAFTPVYERMGTSGLFSIFTGRKGTVEEMSNSIMAICGTIVSAANFFSINRDAFNADGAPSEAWSRNVGLAINSFLPVFQLISENDRFLRNRVIDNMQESMKKVMSSMLDTDKILSKGNFQKMIPDNYLLSLSRAIRSYINMSKELSDSDVTGTMFSRSKISIVSSDIAKLAAGIDRLGNALGKLNDNIDLDKLNALKTVNGSFVLMSLMDTDSFNGILSEIENKSGIYSTLLNNLRDDTNSGATTQSNIIRTPQQFIQDSVANNDNLYEVLLSIDSKLSRIGDEVGTLSDFVIAMQSRNKIR